MWLQPDILFPVRIPMFYANPGLYSPIASFSLPNYPLYFFIILLLYLILSNPILLYKVVFTLIRHPIRPSVGGGTKLEMWTDYNGWLCIFVCDIILVQNNYCTNPNPETESHSGSMVHNGLGDQDPQITLEYDLATPIEIRPLTQHVTYKMGSFIFTAITLLKVDSNTSDSLPITPSTERTNGEKCLCWS